MQQNILEYIKSQRVGVFAIEMPDSSPHAATLHYAATEDASMFFFVTSPHYKKAEALTSKTEARASFVIGVSESDMRTLQMDGVTRMLREDEKQIFTTIYWGKFPEKRAMFEHDLAFVFMPTW